MIWGEQTTETAITKRIRLRRDITFENQSIYEESQRARSRIDHIRWLEISTNVRKVTAIDNIARAIVHLMDPDVIFLYVIMLSAS